ncbi:hypothetical protein F1654_00020 [Alkalicaulis satelles]|uniref:Uncharacterized protein n=1 Tax=Alkalicaulis satelles TaxID=2609175 RepID=A0A5M6ZHY4_9PROT|nr:hypothetical protein [Alkalicaulis satelles]KAA5804436.1 hypothetical protein F1654_00020 [Alkalicaulis satelles]
MRLYNFSAGFRALGGAFKTSREGDALEGVLGEDADRQFITLQGAGVFEGEAPVSESSWSTRIAGHEDALYFHSVSVPVRDDFRRWRLHSTHTPISLAHYRARLRAGLETVIRPRT